MEDVVVRDLLAFSFEQSKRESKEISNLSLLDILHGQYNACIDRITLTDGEVHVDYTLDVQAGDITVA